MDNLIIGTAGHVDHGKTSLIKALTGIDADRLAEEKKRGITIDIGFAHLDLGEGLKLGIVDVPGHEKFIKNMLAGSGGIDLAILVVDAGEGVMPQTREHFEILKLLDIKKGVVAITKTDMAEPDWISMVTEDIRGLTKGSFLESAEIVQTSAYTGKGIDELKSALRKIALGFNNERIKKDFRLPVDRVFSVEGFGTVVTGTLIEGTLSKGESALIYPANAPTKARNLQVHDSNVDTAFCGQRVAINLSSLKKNAVTRGFVVAKPGSMENTFMADVKITLLKNTERTVKNNSRVHFYHGAMESVAKIILLDKDELKPGESAYAQLRLSDETAFKHKDKYIIRFYSPLETIGGGVILNPCPKKRQKDKKLAAKSLETLENGSPVEVAEEFIKELSREFPLPEKISAKANLLPGEADEVVKTLTEKKRVVQVGPHLISAEYFDEICGSAGKILKSFHGKNPLKEGMNPEEFKSRLLPSQPELIVNSILSLLAAKKITGTKNGLIFQNGFKISISDEGLKTIGEIEKIYKDAGFMPPSKDESLSKIKDKNKVKVFESMVSKGILVMIDKQMFFHAESYNKCLDIMTGYVRENGEITLAQFRDLIGASRKYAMALLEYWDSKKITKKTGDSRTLIKK